MVAAAYCSVRSQAGKHDSKNEGITRKFTNKTKQNKANNKQHFDVGTRLHRGCGIAPRLWKRAIASRRSQFAAVACLLLGCHSSTALFSGSSAAVAGDIQSLTALGGTVQTVATVIWQNTIIKGPQMQVLGFGA
ncbi:hypothetical protein GE21DRAFT_1306033 [Neurospora crassa]|nr:hypothetical protein GE21DRAFT_1306033 [Neurospora crassa]